LEDTMFRKQLRNVCEELDELTVDS
jgi:hypothetical protein